jgi:hypothetical protein
MDEFDDAFMENEARNDPVYIANFVRYQYIPSPEGSTPHPVYRLKNFRGQDFSDIMIKLMVNRFQPKPFKSIVS